LETLERLAADSGVALSELRQMAESRRHGGELVVTKKAPPAPSEASPVIVELGRDRHISPHLREMLRRVVLEEYEKWKREHPDEPEGQG
jgi:hypothetical protein